MNHEQIGNAQTRWDPGVGEHAPRAQDLAHGPGSTGRQERDAGRKPGGSGIGPAVPACMGALLR
jgi:hypothetical protein